MKGLRLLKSFSHKMSQMYTRDNAGNLRSQNNRNSNRQM